VLVSAFTGYGARAGATAGAQGIGLVRTEMMFLAASTEPSVDEQVEAYRQVLAPFTGRPVVFRVWDIGSDKALPFTSVAAGPNPALGERGIRYLRREVSLLDHQLAAIAEAAAAAGVEAAVMAPMVSLPDEAAWFAARARTHGIARAGVMIEVPSAALLAAEVLAAVDFASIGTNDLIQFLYAADRSATGALAELADPWQPALLRLLTLVAAAARTSGRPVGACGEAAADPAFAAVLAGLGVTSVSVHPGAVAAVRAALDTAGAIRCALATAAAVAAADFRAARAAALAAITAGDQNSTDGAPAD